MNLTTALNETWKENDDANHSSIKSYDTLGLLLVVAVLSTLLAVVIIVCLLWVCFKCCIQSVWFLKPRSWLRYNTMNFPPAPREVVELHDIGQNSAAIYHRGQKPAYASNRTGISERLGYGRNNRKAAVPYLPPPKTWTPSPPFPPDGPLPPRPHPRHPDLSPSNFRRSMEGPEDTPMHMKHAKSQCQYCGTVRCCPVELEEKLRRIQKKSHRSFRRSKFNMNNLSSSKRSALRPPHNTPDKNYNPGNTAYHYSNRSNISEENEPDYEICPETVLIVSEDSVNQNLEKSRPGSHHSRTLGHSSRNPTIEHPDSKKMLRRSHSQPEIASTHLITATKGQNDVVGATVLKSAGARKKRRRDSLKARKNEMPPSVAVFIESPSSSSSSSTDLTTILNRSQKIYWKIYHPPDDERTFYFEDDRGESEEGEIKDGDEDDDGASDATPSMSWDHLTPDPSPVVNVTSKSDERIFMNMSTEQSVLYSVGNSNVDSSESRMSHSILPRGACAVSKRDSERQGHSKRISALIQTHQVKS